MNLRLDGTGDLDLSGGTLNFIDGQPEIIQAIRLALLTALGEVFYDLDQGLDIRAIVGERKRDFSDARDIVRKTIAAVPGVTSVERCDFTVDSAGRVASVDWAVLTVADDAEAAETTPLP